MPPVQHQQFVGCKIGKVSQKHSKPHVAMKYALQLLEAVYAGDILEVIQQSAQRLLSAVSGASRGSGAPTPRMAPTPRLLSTCYLPKYLQAFWFQRPSAPVCSLQLPKGLFNSGNPSWRYTGQMLTWNSFLLLKPSITVCMWPFILFQMLEMVCDQTYWDQVAASWIIWTYRLRTGLFFRDPAKEKFFTLFTVLGFLVTHHKFNTYTFQVSIDSEDRPAQLGDDNVYIVAFEC